MFWIFLIIYAVLGFIFGFVCADTMLIEDETAWILGVFWGIVLPFMLLYCLLRTIVKWFSDWTNF